jgi:nucleotidyltransferase substrate binding protein (TIGR01987 family)
MAEEKIERFELQRDFFEKALSRLEEVLVLDENDVVRDSIIQRFEFTFEMAWKTMFRYLVDKGEKVAQKAWAVIPVAFEALLISDAGVWDRLREYRNDTSHEYDEGKAIELAAYIRSHGIAAFRQFRDELVKRA